MVLISPLRSERVIDKIGLPTRRFFEYLELNTDTTIENTENLTIHENAHDPHDQYAILEGREGGQTLYGSTVSSGILTLGSTSDVIKGKIIFGTSAYNEVNDRLGIGTNTPFAKLHVVGSTIITQNVGIGTLSPTTQLHTTKGRIQNVTRVTTNTTLDVDHHNVFANTDSSSITITLPVGVAGTYYRIVNTGTSGNKTTITPNGIELLLGENSSFDLFDGESIIIVYQEIEGWY